MFVRMWKKKLIATIKVGATALEQHQTQASGGRGVYSGTEECNFRHTYMHIFMRV